MFPVFLFRYLSRLSKFQRTFSSLQRNCQHSSEDIGGARNVVNKWSVKVPHFGRLCVKTDDSVSHVVVNRLDPHEYPLQDKALLTVLSHQPIDKRNRNLDFTHRLLEDGQQAEVALNSNKCENENKQEYQLQTCQCHFEIPIKFDVDIIVTGQCNVEVNQLENDKIDICVEQGTCALSKIQGQHINIHSAGGHVISKSVLQGNTNIVAQKSASVSVDRVEGSLFSVHSEEGDVKAKAIYADQTNFTSTSGNIHLGSCHKSTNVCVKGKGQLKIDSVDGDLTARLAGGDVEAFLLQHTKVDIETKRGDIKLKVLDSTITEIEIDAAEINVHEDLALTDAPNLHKDRPRKLQGHLYGVNSNHDSSNMQSEGEKHIKLHAAQGKVSIACQDWFASLNIRGINANSENQ